MAWPSVTAAALRLSPSRVPISISERSAAKASSANVPAKQEPGSISAMKLLGVTSTRFKYDVPGAVFLAGNPVATDTSYALLSVEPRLTAIDTIVVDSGSITITTANRLSVPVNVKVTLNGFRNSVGATLVDSSTIPAGNGTYATATVTFNLAAVTVTPPTAKAALHLSFTPVAGDAALGDATVRAALGDSEPSRVVSRPPRLVNIIV